MKYLNYLTVLAIIFSVNVNASPISGPIINPQNNNTYYLLSQSTWTDAQLDAQQMGGNLVTINNQQEHDWVYSTFSNYDGLERFLWIGLNDVVQEGSFVWASGESVSFINWYPGEPNNINDEDYVHLFSSSVSATGQWNDSSDVLIGGGRDIGLYGVVEISNVPVPPAFVLFLSGLLGFFGLSRRRK